MMVAPLRVRVEKNVVTRVHRSLKGKGELNVAVGQEVSPDDVIGSGEVYPGFRTINLAQNLSVSPADVKKYLKRGLGQKIYKGELLAYKDEGFLQRKKVVTSPSDGIVEFFNEQTGEVKLSFLPQKKDLPAGVYGVVEKVDKLRGVVVIRTQVSRVYGLFGTGRNRDGVLRFISRRDELVSERKISAEAIDQIVVGGSLIYKEAISKAISSGVSGIITGGINARDYRGMAGGRLSFPRKLENDIGVSIVVCEGFGSLPLGEDIYNLLLQYNEKFVLLDGNHAIISLPSFESSSLAKVKKTSLPEEVEVLTRELKLMEVSIGSLVRVVGSSYAAEQGKVIAIDRSTTQLPSGVAAYLLTVETKRRKIKIPNNNVELI